MADFNWRAAAEKPAFYDGCGLYCELNYVISAWKEGSEGIIYLIRGERVCQIYPSKDYRDWVFRSFLMVKQCLPDHLSTTVHLEEGGS